MPKRERDEPIGLAALLGDDGAGGCAVQKLDRRELLERVERALQSNADHSLSVLLHVLGATRGLREASSSRASSSRGCARRRPRNV